ncbi:hypothetical protein [Photorhabdus namnaonensis]|uniref:hypothetical protein n=1 Tax=Photorhabdus namnaonensis TaxID=1851568 RepID=UPI000808552A|nr:hypothetical protein [Photorhabdus namnaonensis]
MQSQANLERIIVILAFISSSLAMAIRKSHLTKLKQQIKPSLIIKKSHKATGRKLISKLENQLG